MERHTFVILILEVLSPKIQFELPSLWISWKDSEDASSSLQDFLSVIAISIDALLGVAQRVGSLKNLCWGWICQNRQKHRDPRKFCSGSLHDVRTRRLGIFYARICRMHENREKLYFYVVCSGMTFSGALPSFQTLNYFTSRSSFDSQELWTASGKANFCFSF